MQAYHSTEVQSTEGLDINPGDGPFDGNDPNERPDDSDCWNPDADLACWPCDRAGFETRNPTADTEVAA